MAPNPRQATFGWLSLLCHHIAMTSALTLQFTRVVGGKTLVGLKHTAKNSEGARASADWIEMPPKDVERLIKTLQESLAELSKE